MKLKLGEEVCRVLLLYNGKIKVKSFSIKEEEFPKWEKLRKIKQFINKRIELGGLPCG